MTVTKCDICGREIDPTKDRDPNYSTKVAYYKHHKQVQFKSRHITDDWQDCNAEPYWDDNCEYRIKPEKQDSEHVVQAIDPKCYERCGYCIHRHDGCVPDSMNCINFLSTNEDYFRVKKNYDDLVKEHVELERKYGDLVSGIKQLMHGHVNC